MEANMDKTTPGTWTKHFHRRFSDLSGTVPDILTATRLLEIYEAENKLQCGFATAVSNIESSDNVDLTNQPIEIQWDATASSNSIDVPFLGFPFSLGKKIIIRWPSELKKPDVLESDAECVVLVELITFPSVQISENIVEQKERGVEVLQEHLSTGCCLTEKAWFLQLPKTAAIPTTLSESDSGEGTTVPNSATEQAQLSHDSWGDDLLRNLQDMRKENSRCDITLVGKDGTALNAHAAVLCAASPKFNALLRRSQIKVILKMSSVPTETLKSVVEFMYSGQVDVKAEDVASVQKTAETFEIAELVQACQGLQGEENSGVRSGTVKEEAVKPADEKVCEDRSIHHHHDTTVKCKMLEKSEQPATKPKVHRLRHMWNKRHWCLKCKITLEPCKSSVCNPSYKVARQRDKSKQQQSEFPCTHCDKRFKRKESFLKHQHWHNGTTRYTCQYCSQGFMDKYSFETHIKGHEGIQSSAKCELCGLVLTTKKGLQKHMITIHERRDMHKCDTCGAVYRHRSSFMAHLLMHEGKKPYTCTFCNRGFRVSSHLKSHLRIHTGEKPFACAKCGRNFAHKNSCKSHQSICLGDETNQSGQVQTRSTASAKPIIKTQGTISEDLVLSSEEQKVAQQDGELVYIIGDPAASEGATVEEIPAGMVQNVLGEVTSVEIDIHEQNIQLQMVEAEERELETDSKVLEPVEQPSDSNGQYLLLEDGRKLYISMSQDSVVTADSNVV